MRMRSGPAAVWLARHGESTGNLARAAAERDRAHRIDRGDRDADAVLTPLGERQARGLGAWLAAQPEERRPTVVLSSPYRRALRTAQLAVEAAGPELSLGAVDVDERLRDREMGVLDALTWHGILAAHPQEAARARALGPFHHRPPGGESWADICLRLRSLYADLARDLPQERVLVVAHDVIVGMTRVVLEGLSEDDVRGMASGPPYPNGAVTTYEREDGGYRLTGWATAVVPAAVG